MLSDMGLQKSLNIGDGLSSFLKEDSMDAEGASSGDWSFMIVEEDHLGWLNSKALAGQFEDAAIRLGNAYLVGVDDEVGHFVKMVTFLLSGPGTDKAVADDGGKITRAQAAEVGGQRDV